MDDACVWFGGVFTSSKDRHNPDFCNGWDKNDAKYTKGTNSRTRVERTFLGEPSTHTIHFCVTVALEIVRGSYKNCLSSEEPEKKTEIYKKYP